MSSLPTSTANWIESNYTRILNWLRMRTPDAMIEDIAHDAVVKLLLTEGETSDNYKWRTIRNVHIDEVYRAKPEPEHLDPTIRNNLPNSDPFNVVANRMELEWAAAQLERIESDYAKDVMLMRYIHGLTIQETCEELGLTKGQVKQACLRGQKFLRTCQG